MNNELSYDIIVVTKLSYLVHQIYKVIAMRYTPSTVQHRCRCIVELTNNLFSWDGDWNTGELYTALQQGRFKFKEIWKFKNVFWSEECCE